EEEKKMYGDALRAALMAWPQRTWQRVEIAYLNHGVGGQWSGPTLPELLTDLNSQGIEHVVAYAAEHLVDGSETVQLPDILATESGGASQCLPCLNSAPAFIDFLAQRVRAVVAEETMTLCCDRCPLRHSAT
ncbi:MAG TPA: ferrochelatase, partial [Wenzhouxiangella sp.]|nr:ferrochelatase [Wenzhouxiangella sp.]